ncbi:MAG: ribonuclease HII [Kiritimatiellia bacterium]
MGDLADRLWYERAHWQAYPTAALAGVDEAGRGPLAGPVIAAALVMTPAAAEAGFAGPLHLLTDSKQLTAARREAFYDLLTTTPEIWIGVGWSHVAEIDERNILNATHLAMRRALLALPKLPDHALVDGLPVKGLPCESTAIVKGDAKSLLIAGASVIAKVLRDRRMQELDALYPGYLFSHNKGYGTNEHMLALLRLGPCPEHRRSFRPVQDALQTLPGLSLTGAS